MSPKKVKVLASLSLGIILSVTIYFGGYLSQIRTTYDVAQFFPAHYDGFDDLADIKKIYHLEETPSLIILLKKKSGTWLVEPNMSSLEAFSRDLQKIAGIQKIMSLPLMDTVYQDSESIQIGKLIKLLPESNWSTVFTRDPLVVPVLLSKDTSVAVIAAEFKSRELNDYPEILKSIEDSAGKYTPDSELHFAGLPAIQQSIQSLLREELSRFVIISIAFSVGLIFVIFSRYSAWLTTLITLILANGAVGGLMARLNWPFSVLSTTIPILTAIVVVAQAVYCFFRLQEIENDQALGANLSHPQRVLKMTLDTLVPNFVGHFTTAVGFWTLTWTDVPIIVDFGHAVFLCVIFAWLLTTLSIFGFLCFLPAPNPRPWTFINMDFLRGLLNWRKPIVIGTFMAAGIFALGSFNLNWGARLFDDLPNNHPARTAMERIDREMAGTVAFDIEVQGPNSAFWKDPKNLNLLNGTLQEIRNLPEVGSILALPDFIKVLSQEKSIPSNTGAISEILFMFSLNPNTPLKHYLSANEASIRISTLLKDVPADQSIKAIEQIKTRISQAFPDLRQRYGGVASYIHSLNNDVSVVLMRGFLEALAAIAFILIFIFRSLRWALVACIPNLVPPAILFGVLWLTEVPIKPSLAIVFSISLGFAFNNTVYLLMRVQSLIKERKRMPDMEEILVLEGPGCLFSTVVVLVGFLVFLGAQFSINIMFGTFMIIATLAALFGDLVFFPALIKWFPGLLFTAPQKDSGERTRNT